MKKLVLNAAAVVAVMVGLGASSVVNPAAALSKCFTHTITGNYVCINTITVGDYSCSITFQYSWETGQMSSGHMCNQI